MSLVARSGFLSLARGFGGLLQALIFVLTARQLDPGIFGSLVAIFSLCAFAGVLCDFGLGSLATIAWAREDRTRAAAAVKAQFLPVVLGTIAAAALGVLAFSSTYIGNVEYWGIVVAVAVGVSLEKVAETALSLDIADGRITLAVVSVFGRRAAGLLVFSLLLPIAPTEVAFAASILVSGVLAVLVGLRTIRVCVQEGYGVPIGPLLSSARPFLVTNVSAQLRSLDAAVLAVFSGTVQAGLYGASQRLTNPIFMISSSVASIVMPHVARSDSATARRFTVRLVLFGSLLSIIAIPFAILAPWVVALIYGADFAGAASSLAVLMLALGISAIVGPVSSIAQAAGQASYLAKTNLALAPVTLGLMVVGAIWGGALGAALAVSLAAGLRLGFAIYAVKRSEQEASFDQ
jgi:O-antigen/teichoic acid export membrane protein